MAAPGERDPKLSAARYAVDRMAAESAAEGDDEPTEAGAMTMDERTAFIESTLQQAIRRGDFDDLPGAGKPLPGLGGRHDPDWWIRRKIERENLTGLGPPALTLRSEAAELEQRIDRLHREADVREVLDDFNRRVVDARRQLQGGPPVVTPTRDVDAELTAWRARRAARSAASDAVPEAPRERPARRRWFRRRAEGG
jgi:hypothetical protein